MKRLLFIAWDGGSPHYMQGLFMPIMAGLQAEGYDVTILQLSAIKPDDVAKLTAQAELGKMTYHHISVNRNSRGFVKAVIDGKRFIKAYAKANPDAVLMPRSLMPSLMLLLGRLGKSRVVYDADGLKLEERVDFAGWKPSELRYKVFRKIERWIYKKANVILTRSYQAKEVMINDFPFLSEKPICKVVNGKDVSLFKPLSADIRSGKRAELGLKADTKVVVYCGTIAPQYCLDQMLQWFGWLQELQPESKFLIISGDLEKIKAHADFEKFKDALILTTVPAVEVPAWLGLADMAFALRSGSHSMKGVAPIKIGEYLLCGLPVIASKGIGDTEADLTPLQCSQVIDETSEQALKDSFVKLTGQSGDEVAVPLPESVACGKRYYSLEAAVDSYLKALQQIRFK